MEDTFDLDELFEGVRGEEEEGIAPHLEPEVGFITGPAGSGKTYSVRKKIEEEPGWGVLCATTGIAAVNLGPGVRTLNSLLGYYNTASLEEAWQSGKLFTRMRRIAQEGRVKNICCDEVSMMPGQQLDTIYAVLEEVNDKVGPLGLVLTGDFCQLPPVSTATEPAKWAFEADCWPRFAENTTKLTKIWRQDGGSFLDALNHYRAGRGLEGTKALLSTGAELTRALDDNFEGVTIVATNKEVEAFNLRKLFALNTRKFEVKSYRWGDKGVVGQWREIPDKLDLKLQARVMILANDTPGFRWVNGDVGDVVDFEEDQKGRTTTVMVRLARNQSVVPIQLIQRQNHDNVTPDRYRRKKGEPEPKVPMSASQAKEMTGGQDLTHWDEEKQRWVTGEIYYFPLRLGWATTVHKSQGLTLSNVQVDIKHGFFGSPAMLYVALSRCKTPEGLKVVGTEGLLVERCKVDRKVEGWL